MIHAVAIVVALLTADPVPTHVSIKVLYGTGDESQKAEIEPWISKAVSEAGSPVATPYTGWIKLTGEEQELYASMMGGRLIKGKMSAKDGSYEVEISGSKIGALKRTITLKPGERQVLKLTDYPAPNNVFIALDASLRERATNRAQDLKANAKSFRLELNYSGDQDKPFYQMIVSVPVIDQLANDPFYRIVQIKEDEAIKVIDHLAKEGFFDQAVDLRSKNNLPPPTMPGYSMKVEAGDISLREELGWGLPMIERLECLRDVLPDSGKKDMEFLLGRLTGLRKQWQAEESALHAEVGREGSRVRFLSEEEATIFDVASEFGIDKATIKREAQEWPKAILVRLHLGGLESLKASVKGVAVEWSIASTGDHEVTATLVSGKGVAVLTKDSPFFGEVRIVGGEKAFPLKDGYFEVVLPAKLLEGNPAEITLEWTDFYRQ